MLTVKTIVYIDKHVADNDHRLPASLPQSLYDTRNNQQQISMKLCYTEQNTESY